MPAEANPITTTCGHIPRALTPTTPQIITDLIRGLIHRGTLGPGDRLPPERALAGRLGVARVSLRESLGQLQEEGYLVARRGALGGTFVTELTEPRRRWFRRMRENLADLEDIMDYRIAVEAHVVRLAAGRRDEAGLRAIEDALRRQSELSDASSLRAVGRAFHRAIAAAARSPRLGAALDEARVLPFPPPGTLLNSPRIDRSLGDHVRIAAAVRDRDGDRAAAVMREHLESARDWLRHTLAAPDAVSPGTRPEG